MRIEVIPKLIARSATTAKALQAARDAEYPGHKLLSTGFKKWESEHARVVNVLEKRVSVGKEKLA